jgi:hypothetical protein
MEDFNQHFLLPLEFRKHQIHFMKFVTDGTPPFEGIGQKFRCKFAILEINKGITAVHSRGIDQYWDVQQII